MVSRGAFPFIDIHLVPIIARLKTISLRGSLEVQDDAYRLAKEEVHISIPVTPSQLKK